MSMYAYNPRMVSMRGIWLHRIVGVEKRAWILHVSKEPFHGCLRIAVARREQSFLATDQRKTHRFELGERGLVELG